MSIKDNVNEISENNVTIAEVQQKVYEAGVRAGLAQDPDYAEGYDDGYEQGLTDSSGVVWEDLLSGKVPVGKAREADHAVEADHASQATHANSATTATKANEADHATNAEKAINAHHSTNADHSTEADHSVEADHSTKADHATKADSSSFADHATTATTASSANTATNAGHANEADFADDLSKPLSVEKGGTGADNASQAIVNLGIHNYQKPWDVNENIDSIVTNPHNSSNIGAAELSCESLELIEGTGADEEIRTYRFIHRIPMINSGRVYLHFSPYIDYDNAPWSGNGDEHMDLRVYSGDRVVYEEHRLLDKDSLIITSTEERRPEWILIDVVKGVDVKLEAVQRKRVYRSGNKHYGFTFFDDIYLMANMDTPYKYTSLIGMKSPSYFEQ